MELLRGGESVRFVAYWIARAGSCELLQDATVTPTEPATLRYVAPEGSSGVVWLCADNVASWWYPKVIKADIVREAAAAVDVQ